MVTIGVVTLDQVTKALVVSNLALYESWAPIESLSHLFTITYTTNTGAAFGILPNKSLVFLVIDVIIIIGLLYYYFTLSTKGDWPTRLALGLMLGGASGNLIDRVRQGHVTDFIHFSFWPVFNIADSCIVIGVVLLTAILLWQDRKTQTDSSSDDTAPDG